MADAMLKFLAESATIEQYTYGQVVPLKDDPSECDMLCLIRGTLQVRFVDKITTVDVKNTQQNKFSTPIVVRGSYENTLQELEVFNFRMSEKMMNENATL